MRRRSDAERRKILRELQASGLSVRAFSQKHGVAESNLAKWKQRYAAAGEPKASFVELKAMTMLSEEVFHYELELGGRPQVAAAPGL